MLESKGERCESPILAVMPIACISYLQLLNNIRLTSNCKPIAVKTQEFSSKDQLTL